MAAFLFRRSVGFILTAPALTPFFPPLTLTPLLPPPTTVPTDDDDDDDDETMGGGRVSELVVDGVVGREESESE